MMHFLAEDGYWDRFPPTYDSEHGHGLRDNFPEDPQNDERSDPLFPQELNDNVLLEVPYLDPTYTAIDGILLPSRSSLRVQLCRFKTFQGFPALQPCISSEGQLNMFDALKEWETPLGHKIYKDARLWACIVQAFPGLPIPCRWLAATVYNFANDMLRPDNSQDFMWDMRPWLFHWYSVADLLFEELDIDLGVPEMDWFQPAVGNGTELSTIREESPDDSSSSDGTVVHSILSAEAPEFIHGSALHMNSRTI